MINNEPNVRPEKQKKVKAVAKDVSIVGFDDTQVARQVWPRLATVRQPIRKLSAAASFSLITHLRGHPVEKAREMIECEIILRESAVTTSLNP